MRTTTIHAAAPAEKGSAYRPYLRLYSGCWHTTASVQQTWGGAVLGWAG